MSLRRTAVLRKKEKEMNRSLLLVIVDGLGHAKKLMNLLQTNLGQLLRFEDLLHDGPGLLTTNRNP